MLFIHIKHYLYHTLYYFITKNQLLKSLKKESVLPVGLGITDSHHIMFLKNELFDSEELWKDHI